MDYARAAWLVSPEGREALEDLPPGFADLPPLQRVEVLRKRFDPAASSALSEQLELRAAAMRRFGHLPLQFLNRPGLEMMTHPLVASRRADRLSALAMPVADLTCGIGGDLAAFAAAGIPAVGVERDPGSALLASANVPTALVCRGDATCPPIDPTTTAIFLDPARRSGATRRFNPSAFTPSWDECLRLLDQAPAGAIKGPPGLPSAALPAAAEVEWVQLSRSMREVVCYTGHGATPGLRRAVLLPGPHTLDNTAPEAPAETRTLGQVIYDPESCITLAGLVRHLAATLNARLLDPNIAYLTGDTAVSSPLATAFEVLDVVPFSVARLASRLRTLGLRPTEIRRRAFPIEPDELHRLLGKFEGDPATVLCTTILGKRLAIIARPLKPEEIV